MKKYISFLILIFISLSFSISNANEIDRTNYIAIPSGKILSDEDFMRIRAEQEEKFKKEKIYFENIAKKKKTKENKKILETKQKDFNAQINHINDMIKQGTSKCKIITKKTYTSLNAKQYEINSLKESIGEKRTNFREGFYYNPNNNTCIETTNYIGNNIFPSREKCNICLEGELNMNSGTIVTKKIKTEKNNIKQTPIKIYSDELLNVISDNIMTNKNNKELLELQLRARNIINTLENTETSIKESTKINFIRLLTILDSKIYEKLENQNKINTKEEIQTNDEEEEKETLDFMKSLFGDDL